jgi:hypothetical protein
MLSDGCFTKMADYRSQFLHVFALTLCLISVSKYVMVSLCRAASALCPFGMTYSPLFYVVMPSMQLRLYALMA